MRLSDAQLKEGFLHPNRVVRDAVARFFDDSLTRDPAVTQYVMRGVELYGWKNVLTWPHKVSTFPIADDASMEWLCQQLTDLLRGSANDNLRGHLGKMLARAEIGLLESHNLSERFDELQLEERHRELIVRRMTLSNRDPEDCWQALQDHCQQAAQAATFADAKIPDAELLLEPLLSCGDRFVPRILEILQRPAVDPEVPDADAWLIGLMIILAGRMRLEAAAPLMWKYWDVDWDWYNDELLYALTRIGTPSVAQLIRERYPHSKWHVQLFASGALERLRCDGMREVIEELLANDADDEFRGRFGVAAARQFDDDTAGIALRVWNEDPDFDAGDSIRENLIAFSYLSGWELPEQDEWEKELLAENDRFKNAMDADFISKLAAQINPPASQPASRIDKVHQPKPPVRPSDLYSAPAPMGPRFQAGRNDPCPCGSGNKFKKCCLNGTAATR